MRFDVTASPESMYKICNFLNKEYNSQIQKNWTNEWRKQFLQLEGKDEKVAWSLIPVRAVIGAAVRRPCSRPITVLWLNQQAFGWLLLFKKGQLVMLSRCYLDKLSIMYLRWQADPPFLLLQISRDLRFSPDWSAVWEHATVLCVRCVEGG